MEIIHIPRPCSEYDRKYEVEFIYIDLNTPKNPTFYM